MASTDTESLPARSIDLRSVLLAISIVLFYFLFQLIVIFTSIVGLDGACLYSFWLPEINWWQNPFWLVVAIVCGLLLLSLFLLVDGLSNRTPSRVVVGLTAVALLGLWLNSLNWLWDAMLYEKGEISADQWFIAQERPALLMDEPHICLPGSEN